MSSPGDRRPAPKAPAKPRAQLQDESIMGTNNSSIISKRSVERLYFPNEPHFFRYFVKKPQRRSPLINRGYWLRMRAIDQVVRRFLEQPSDKAKIVINLGCGYDPLPWQCLTRYSSACQGVTFVDIDYQELMINKRDVVKSSAALNSILTNVQIPPEGNVLFKSEEYLQLGCDLRDLTSLKTVLSSAVDIKQSLVLFTAEVSITYMDLEAADALIEWAGTLPHAKFCLLEQLLPEGIDHPFARTMMAHFDKLQTPLRSVQAYPTTEDQRKRFENRGWPIASVCNLWELWSSSEFASKAQREELDSIEPFDEWEEFALFGCHYVLLVADTSATSHFPGKILPPPHEEEFLASSSKATLQMETSYEGYPKAYGCNRFAAVMRIRGQVRTQDCLGVFGGMGPKTRVNSIDQYTTGRSLAFDLTGPRFVPASRMCHTITDIGDEGALLVGGRTSPDTALKDCWLFHKWLNQWERVDDLPIPLYRHQAADLGCGRVLVTTGRVDSRSISDSWYIWTRYRGWVQCAHREGEVPPATHGATLVLPPSETGEDQSSPKCGIITGGLSPGGLLQQRIWKFEIAKVSSEEPTIAFQEVVGTEDTSTIARFGASVTYHKGRVYLIGGILKNRMLSPSHEVSIIDFLHCTISPVSLSYPPDTPRPLLVGVTVADTGESLVFIGGSAVCFSFGTFWNKGCLTIKERGSSGLRSPTSVSAMPWRYLRTTTTNQQNGSFEATIPTDTTNQLPTNIPRIRITSTEDFSRLVQAAQPVILENLDVGVCSSIWTSEYLKEKVGAGREVIVHKATTDHMNFKAKNFTYISKPFGEFLDQIDAGEKLYLRSLSSDRPAEMPANITVDFPTLAGDFTLPSELRVVEKTLHSSPLRISGPVIMWLHYDVMANVLCQIRGSKRLLLFPPSDIKHFDFEPGASSSHINVFEKPEDPKLSHTHPHEALLQPGDLLFLPPLWLHSASPSSGVSIAVNTFFRNLHGGYAAGKDVYGNRDLQAYEKGRQDISKIIKSFDSMPLVVRAFYLQRLVDEFEQKAS